MRELVPSAIAALAAMASAPVSAQAVSERVIGTERVCTYTVAPLGNRTRQLRVGQGDACPAYYPPQNTDLPTNPPPTARLASTEVDNGRRVCTYGQRGRFWAYRVDINENCPLAAGMLGAEREPASRVRTR